ncbi:uncharacterized protein LOC123262391 [Cotesia glomerata]|uniref:BEN domain-containing protein n=1 Tax=Cotesia glomerata TaxID=32391 RepID=A0AAV7J6I6_COTGL|nr:uncharacterized protein LOC123262391 [Cotesia glomerata]KAH0567884.1 hypothetical protein KQX54_015764 [Cotesia glomerata]
MFLVQSDDDNRAYIVDYENIENAGKHEHEILKNDIVKFTINKKQHDGQVLEFSNNSQYLKNQRSKFNKMIDEKKKLSAEITTKRKPVPKRSWSPNDSPPSKKPKKPLKITKNTKSKKLNESSESSMSSNISIESSDNEFSHQRDQKPSEEIENISPSKDDLKKQIELLKAQKRESLSAENRNVCTLTPHNQSNKLLNKKMTSEKNVNQVVSTEKKTDEVEVKDKNDSGKLNESQKISIEQLFSPNYDDGKMKQLGNDVYCREVIYSSALGASHKATHLARRLLEGVFKHEALMGCTLTGQAPRGTSKKLIVKPLDQRAKDAIVDFSMRIATEKIWPSQNRGTIFKEMSQKLTEYKRDHNKKNPTQQ